ncbi:hypothetical protein [Nocardioides sp. InS609-2]|uniref:hypothetical protein n=1 Tax=Nocardioides sp. InS609-2 TaxID=2760705 RepID=UPI0020C13C66|nr:hypothetical protein [Nocardioides sp. InS609-2]
MSDGFVEVYDTITGLKQRVPAHFVDDPILGRNIQKTPSQRALEGQLGQAPTEASTVAEIRSFADEAEIDVSGLRKHADLLGAVQAVVGTDPLPEPATPGVDVELGGGPSTDVDTPIGDTPSPDGTEPSDNSAADAGQE